MKSDRLNPQSLRDSPLLRGVTLLPPPSPGGPVAGFMPAPLWISKILWDYPEKQPDYLQSTLHCGYFRLNYENNGKSGWEKPFL